MRYLSVNGLHIKCRRIDVDGKQLKFITASGVSGSCRLKGTPAEMQFIYPFGSVVSTVAESQDAFVASQFEAEDLVYPELLEKAAKMVAEDVIPNPEDEPAAEPVA